MKHIQQLDGLRAFSVISVILYHLGIPGFGMGWLGVSFFFVLSGFWFLDYKDIDRIKER